MNIFTLVAALTLNSASYEKGLKDAEGKANTFGSKLKNGLSTAAKVTGAALTAASGVVIKFGADAVKTGKTFDASMAQVAATMGMTMNELQTNVGSTETSFGHFEGTLRDFAQFMGANTAFSASQAADALNYMALAGYDAQTSMDMLPNVLNLAAAGGIELASASDMVTDAQSALGLSLEETSKLVDKMAKASSKSNTSVAQLGAAMLTIGGTAKNLSGGTTELATALGILADNGIKGSEGGTALRNILLSLTPKSEDAAEAMEAIGMKAYDANGNMRPLRDIFADMNEAMKDMSTEQRQNTLAAIFNKVDLKSVNALMATTTDRWWELSDSIDGAWGTASGFDKAVSDMGLDINKINYKSLINGFESLGVSAENVANAFDWTKGNAEEFANAIWEVSASGVKYEDVLAAMPTDLKTLQEAFDNTTGAAQAMADTQLDNLAGDITLFQSALEGAKIAVSDKLTPTIREFVQFGSEAVSTISTAFKEGGLSGAMDALGKTLSKGLTLITKNLPKVAKAAVSLVGAFVRGIRDNASQLLDATLEIIEVIANAVTDNFDYLVQAVFDVILLIAKSLTNGDTIDALITAIFKIVDSIAMWLGEYASVLIEAAINLFNKVLDSLLSEEMFSQLLETLIVLINYAAEEIVENLPVIVQSIVDFLLSAIPMLIDAGIQLLTALTDNIDQIAEAIVATLPIILDAIVGFYNSNDSIAQIIKAGVDLLTALVENIGEIIVVITKALPDIIRAIVKYFGDNIGDIVQAGIDLLTSLVNSIDEIIDTIVEVLPEIVFAVVDELTKPETLKTIAKAGFDMLVALVGSLAEIVIRIVSAIPEIVTGIVRKLGELEIIERIRDAGYKLFTNIVGRLRDAIDFLKEKVKGIVTSIADKIISGIGAIRGAGKYLIEGLWNGIGDKLEWLWEQVKGVAGQLIDKVKGFFGIKSPSRIMRDQVGKYLVYGIGDGITAFADYAIDAMEGLSDDLLNAAPNEDDFDFLSGGASVAGGKASRNGVAVTQNIYAAKMAPSEVFAEARLEQERWAWMSDV